MTSFAHTSFDKLFRSADELIASNDPKWREVERNGQVYGYHDYEIGVDSLKYKTRATSIGHKAVGVATMSDGVKQVFEVNMLNELHRRRGGAFTVAQGAAWLTSGTGDVLSAWNDQVAAEIGVDTVKVGARNSGKRVFGLASAALLPIELGKTFRQAQHHTLSKGAQSKQAIIQGLIEEFDFAEAQYRRSISMDAMENPYESLYTESLAHSHIIVPCVMDDLELNDLPRFGKWTGQEARGTAKLTLEAIRTRKIKALLGTASLNPHFLISSFAGNMPALASGEAGDILRSAPFDDHRTVSLHTGDLMSVADRPEVFLGTSSFVNVFSGYHVDAVGQGANARDLAMVERFGEELAIAGGNFDAIDRLRVSEMPEAEDHFYPASVAA